MSGPFSPVRSPSLPRPSRLSIYEGPDDRPRHATWLELFFDLVFVVALARLGTTLHHHLTPVGFVEFALLFLLLWWLWLGFSYYADLFGAEDPLSKLTFLVAMAAVLYVSHTIPEATGEGSFAFAVGTLALRLLLTASFFRARHMASERPYIALDGLTTFVWGLSLFAPPGVRLAIWVGAVVLNTVGIAVVQAVTDETAAQTSHFPERLGLFTIIVLGETILAVSFGITVPILDVTAVVTAVSGFAISVAAWWLYFWRYDEDLLDRALGAPSAERITAGQRGVLYVFSHYGVHAGIVAAGVGIGVAVESELAAHALGVGGLLALNGGVGAFLFSSSYCHRSISELIDGRVARTRRILAVALLLLVPAGTLVRPAVVVTAVALALVGLAAYEGYVERTGTAALGAAER